jgi:hypothetical protein
MELTEWYPAHIKPVRQGVYELEVYELDYWKFTPTLMFSCWDGKQWLWIADNVDKAATRICPAQSQNRRWRGLAARPQVSTL